MGAKQCGNLYRHSEVSVRRRGIIQFLLVLAFSIAGVRQGVAAGSVAEELQKQWDFVRNTVLAVAAAIPEDKYDYRPTPEVRSFREQLTHIVDETLMYTSLAAGKKSDRNFPQTLQRKDEIRKALAEAYGNGDKLLAGFTDQQLLELVPGRGGEPQTRMSLLVFNILDNMDHYGNLVVYMRVNRLVPPRTADRPPR